MLSSAGLVDIDKSTASSEERFGVSRLGGRCQCKSCGEVAEKQEAGGGSKEWDLADHVCCLSSRQLSR